MSHRWIISFFLFLSCIESSYGQVGIIDESFASHGYWKRIPYFDRANLSFGINMAVQRDGKIIVFTAVNSYTPYKELIRLDHNGKPDNSFGKNGVTRDYEMGPYFVCSGMLIQNDGKILLYGTKQYNGRSDLAIYRFTANGDRDMSFGSGAEWNMNFGSNYDRLTCATMLPNGDFMVAGRTLDQFDKILLFRFHSDGSVDSSFCTHGHKVFYIGNQNNLPFAIVPQKDHKLVMSLRVDSGQNRFFPVVQLFENGTIDSSFGVNGYSSVFSGNTQSANSLLAIDSMGRIIQSVSTISQVRMCRYFSDGRIDSGFGNLGQVEISNLIYVGLEKIHCQHDNKILLLTSRGSYPNEFSLWRLDSTGNPDTDFDLMGNGKITSLWYGARDFGATNFLFQPNGKLIVCGCVRPGGSDGFFLLERFFTENSLQVKSIIENRTMRAYPNPVSNEFMLGFTVKKDTAVEIKLLDMKQREIQDLLYSHSMGAGFYLKKMVLNDQIAPGIYLIRLIQGKDIETLKILVVPRD